MTDHIGATYCQSHRDTLKPSADSTTTNLHKFWELGGMVGMASPTEEEMKVQKT